MATQKHRTSDKPYPQGRQRNYRDIIAYLDQRWDTQRPNLSRAKELDRALGFPSKKIKAIFVAGTNGKSTTIDLTAGLLKAEGLSVGICTSPHIVAYNERIALSGKSIDNPTFTKIANEVITAAEEQDIDAHSLELLTLMAINYFAQQNVDVALFEVIGKGQEAIAQLCTPLVTGITRVTDNDPEAVLTDFVNELMDGLVQKDTVVVSGDQNKANLVRMEELTKQMNGSWAMPIRKLAPLPYPFEQLYGRCGSLAERIAQLFVDTVHNKGVTITANSILSRKKTKRGRPTSEAKRKAELQPVKSVEQYWHEYSVTRPGQFEILDQENPCVVLDTASNTDALKNVLLGLRLLHYTRHFKGCALIVAAAENTLDTPEFLKLMRYFFKKMSGAVIICPLTQPTPGSLEQGTWNSEKITNAIKSLRVRAFACSSLEEALKVAHEQVDQKSGLICLTGSRSIPSAYWKMKSSS